MALNRRAFLGGMLTGIVEPVMSFSAVIFSEFISSCYVFTLGFAAGSMIYVVIKELIPDIYSDCEHFGRCEMLIVAEKFNDSGVEISRACSHRETFKGSKSH